MTWTWSEISLGPDDELSGRVKLRGNSGSTSESESIEIENDVDFSQKHLREAQAKNNEGTVHVCLKYCELVR